MLANRNFHSRGELTISHLHPCDGDQKAFGVKEIPEKTF